MMNSSDRRSKKSGSWFRSHKRHRLLPGIRLKYTFLPILLVGLILALIGCSAADDTEEREVDIRGKIVEVHRMETPGSDSEAILGSILVEGVIEADTKYDKASITITGATDIYEQTGQERVQLTFDDVSIGQLAEVSFAGPVRETYPLQGSAAELVILN
jgi:hypothetical protein